MSRIHQKLKKTNPGSPTAKPAQNAPDGWRDACHSLAQTCSSVSTSLDDLQSDLQAQQRDTAPVGQPSELAPCLPLKSMDALQECVQQIADLTGAAEGVVGRTGSQQPSRHEPGTADQTAWLLQHLTNTAYALEGLDAALVVSALPRSTSQHDASPPPLPASSGLARAEELERLVEALSGDIAAACRRSTETRPPAAPHDTSARSPQTADITQLETQHAELTARVAQQDTQLQALKEEAEHSTRLLESAQSELRKAEDEKLAHKSSQAELLKQAEKIRKLEQELSSQLSAQRQAQGRSISAAAAADLESRISKLESELAVSRAYVNNTTRKLKALQEANTALRTELVHRPVSSEPQAPPETALSPERPSGDWFLQVEESQVYGPVEASVLQEWAADCRVGPDHLVSRDRETWVQAQELPFLQMDWYVTLPDETNFGPLNLFAIQHLVSDGSVKADSSATHRSESRTVPLDELLSPELSRLAGTHADLTLRVDRLQAELEYARQQLAALQQQRSDAGGAAATPAAQPPKFARKKRSR